MSFCIFCQIIKGKLPAYKVFENNKVLAFLDVNPSVPGHTLVIPKTHVAQLEDLSKDNVQALFQALHKLVGDVQIAMDAPSSTIGINNGPEAGQEVPHIHIHIIPRKTKGQGRIIQTIIRTDYRKNREEFKQIADKIRRETGWS